MAQTLSAILADLVEHLVQVFNEDHNRPGPAPRHKRSLEVLRPLRGNPLVGGVEVVPDRGQQVAVARDPSRILGEP